MLFPFFRWCAVQLSSTPPHALGHTATRPRTVEQYRPRSGLSSSLWSRLLGVRSIDAAGGTFRIQPWWILLPAARKSLFLLPGRVHRKGEVRRSVEPFRSPHRRAESKHLYRFRLVSAQL